MNTRIQLSLYVPQPALAGLETVRRLLDPVQARLIPAHVTLCREDELADLDAGVLRSRLSAAEQSSVTLRFGPPESFQGHGILLPCVGGAAEFYGLRRTLLGSPAIRHQSPHITLAHPRNPKSPGNRTSYVWPFPGELSIAFEAVSVIRQVGSAPWQVLDRYALEGG